MKLKNGFGYLRVNILICTVETPCFTLIEQALSVFLTLIIFNDPWVLPDEVCVIVFTFFHEGEYDP